MEFDLPFWIKQRQAKVEEVATGTYRITGPNLAEAVVGVRMTDALSWQSFVREKADGPDVAVSLPVYKTARDAVGVALELYRRQYVV